MYVIGCMVNETTFSKLGVSVCVFFFLLSKVRFGVTIFVPLRSTVRRTRNCPYFSPEVKGPVVQSPIKLILD